VKKEKKTKMAGGVAREAKFGPPCRPAELVSAGFGDVGLFFDFGKVGEGAFELVGEVL